MNDDDDSDDLWAFEDDDEASSSNDESQLSSFEEVQAAFSHISEETISAASALRFDAQDAELDLGILMQSRAKGDCAWFLLTNDGFAPITVLCAILCTPYCTFVEFISEHGSYDPSLLSNDPTPYFTYLKGRGYRKLTPEQLQGLG